MPTHYNKLVRDGIPALLAAAGLRYAVRTLDDAAYVQALREKLCEEAAEARAAVTADALVTELADVLEVVAALCAAHGTTLAALAAEQQRRRAERGGFVERLLLEWTAPAEQEGADNG